MSAQIRCVRCGTLGSVRREYVMNAKTSFAQHDCGHCSHSWRVYETDDPRGHSEPVKTAESVQTDHSR